MNSRYFYPKKLPKNLSQPITEEEKSYKKEVKMKAALTMGTNDSYTSFSPFKAFKNLFGSMTQIFKGKSNQKQQHVFFKQDTSRFTKSAKIFLSESTADKQRPESYENLTNGHTGYILKKSTDNKYSNIKKSSSNSFTSLKLLNRFKRFTRVKNQYSVNPLFALKVLCKQNSENTRSNSTKISVGAYTLFFTILALFPVFYIDEQSSQSVFLNWVQAKEPAISRSLYPNASIEVTQTINPNLANSTAGFSRDTSSMLSRKAVGQNYPDVVVINSGSSELLEPAKIMGKVDFSSGGNQLPSTSGAVDPSGGSPSPIEVVIDPNRIYKDLDEPENAHIINAEYANETISEENIGDWVDENDQDLFANPAQKKVLTKIDKVKQAFGFRPYTVKSGDSLWVIAKRFSISIDSLLSLNKITNPQGLVLGSKLKIPKLSGIYYEVKQNDSLSKIAGEFNVKINRIDEYNNLGKYLKKGELIFIPGGQYSRFQKDYIFGNLFVTPVRGAISSKYGFRIHPIKNKRLFHTGIDISKNNHEKVRAAADGVIVKAGVNGNYGKYILIKHKMGYETAYAHLSGIWVKLGQKVKKGQFIGRVGNTGLSTGPHLHFEVKQGGKFINPLRFVKY